MDRAQLERDINEAWEARDSISAETTGAVRDAVTAALSMMDDGSARVAEPLGDHQWHVNQWLKKAVLLSFRLNDMAVIPSGTQYAGSGEATWWDKVPSKFAGWGEAEFRKAGFRAVPGCVVRHSAHIAAGACVQVSSILAPALGGNWSIPGRQLDPARRSARMSICRAVPVSVVFSSRSRPAR